MLSGEEPEARPPPVPAVVMPEPEALVRSSQVRRRYILKQDVARYGPTPGCVREWEAFRVPSLSSAAEKRRLAMTIGLSSSRNTSLWRK